MESNNPNIAASWPIIVNEQALNEASILPHLLHEASEEALQQQQQINERNGGMQPNGAALRKNNNDGGDLHNEEQLQSMIENYSKHVIRQKQQQQEQHTNRKSSTSALTGRSASHLQRKMNAPRLTPMSHSHPCLFSEDTDPKIGEEQTKRVNTIMKATANYQYQQSQQAPQVLANLYSQPNYEHQDGPQQKITDFDEQQMNDDPHAKMASSNYQLKQQIERLQRKCDRLEQLESAYKRIERDCEQMLAQQERREGLSRAAIQKLEQQLRLMTAENEQLRAQNSKLNAVFGSNGIGDQHEPPAQIHFLLNELIPKNNELLVIQERQRVELEAQRVELEAQNATLAEQRTHIEVLEKALTNAQERLAAKERTAIDAIAVVDKCTHLQRMLQEALEDKQRTKEQHGRQVAQLEMELTQLRLQLAKESSTQAALGSLGRKAAANMMGSGTTGGGGAHGSAGGTNHAAETAAEEVVKLRKALSQKEERISQLEQSLMQMQANSQNGNGGGGGMVNGIGGARIGAGGSGRTTAEMETRAMRLELEKAEKERRIQELLDEKMRIQMQWTDERRTLDVRVRMLEKELRCFMGSQSSLASSTAAAGWGAGSAIYPPDMTAEQASPFASIRSHSNASYHRHRSTAELPTSARAAALNNEYDERIMGIDVVAKMEELGRKLAERRAKSGGISQIERTTTVQRPSELGIVQVQKSDENTTMAGMGIQSRSSSGEKPSTLADMSPCSDEHLAGGVAMSGSGGGTPLFFHRQSAPSSAGSSHKKRYLVNAPTTANQLNDYLEQLPEATRRRFTGERIGSGQTAFHLMATAGGIDRTTAGGTTTGGVGRREGGCRRLIRDHSVDVAARKGATSQQQSESSAAVGLMPPPNYMEVTAQRREAPPPPPAYQAPQMGSAVPTQCRQLHQMSSIEEPIQEAPRPPVPPPHPLPTPTATPRASVVNIVEVGTGDDQQQQGDSDTLTGHKQLIFRRSSLGNANYIAK